MIWVIIACTLLIIVCLGGGKRLGQILLGVIAAGALFVWLFSEGSGGPPIETPFTFAGLLPILIFASFFVVLAIGARLKAKGPPSWW